MAAIHKKTKATKSPQSAETRARMFNLSAEMLRLAFDIQSQLGVDPRESRRIVDSAKRLKKQSAEASDEILKLAHGMTRVLAKWHKSPEYAAADGSPKVLPIFGKGVSFETLVKRYLPQLNVLTAVDFVTSHGDVRRQPEDRIALLGSPAIIVDRSCDIAMALIIQRFRRLSRSVVVNSSLPQNVKATGRYERQVTGWMTKKQFEQFSSAIRGQLQDVVDHVDGRLEEDRPKDGTLYECGLSVFLWADF